MADEQLEPLTLEQVEREAARLEAAWGRRTDFVETYHNHLQHYRCHVCGKASDGPQAKWGILNGERVLHQIRWNKPTGLTRCSTCKRWACADHSVNKVCQKCRRADTTPDLAQSSGGLGVPWACDTPAHLAPLVPVGYLAIPFVAGKERFWAEPAAAHIVEVCGFGATTRFCPTEAAALKSIRGIVYHVPAYGVGVSLHAYRALPVPFDRSGQPRVLPPAEVFGEEVVGAEFDLTGYTRLGYGVVEYSEEDGMGTNPLWAYGHSPDLYRRLNRYCLFEDLVTACEYALGCGVAGPDPNPYIVVEVWRKDTPDQAAAPET